MARTCNAVKRQKVATVESALFNPDVVFLLSALLDARDLCQVSLTCKALGGRQASHANGLSLVEEAARRLFECASDWDEVVPSEVPRRGLDRAASPPADAEIQADVRPARGSQRSARRGEIDRNGVFGVIRPVQIKRSDFDEGGLNYFDPSLNNFWGYLLGQRTARWTDSNVHCCKVSRAFAGDFASWYDWAGSQPKTRIDGLRFNTPIGLLLDLDEGALSVYQNGQRLATLKDGLSGEYCWYATVWYTSSFSIGRELAPGNQRTG
ncbi:hypothetical protein THAOC_23240 [Thalassiosira oceanica]|uniref:SPRY domain-containing protein n=1 Tax=Thalassiosira oceanica TaxID=159749 RepID=K0RWI5_THAOC|nr:hypothetical protein THAOC_23240 [Thalassiosira oceanica]|eukprot:EJK56799.1 hypothetical protein THAOC_23240 [Thalassiosira oceanica]